MVGSVTGDVVAGMAAPHDNGPSAAYVRRQARARPDDQADAPASGGGLLSEAEKRPFRIVGGRDATQQNPPGGPAPEGSGNGQQAMDGPVDAALAPPAEGALGEPGATNMATVGVPGMLAGQIRSDWMRNKRARDRMEYRLLACLYARRAEYQLDELNGIWTEGCGDAIYLGSLAAKMRVCEAMCRDLVLPEGDKPWALEPPPIPDLPPAVMKTARSKALQKAQEQLIQIKQQQGKLVNMNEFVAMRNQLIFEAEQQARKDLEQSAKERVERMEENVEQRFLDGDFKVAMNEYLHHFATFPTAVLKGPIPTKKRKLEWTSDNRPMGVERTVPIFCAVHPLDCYPAPEAKSAQDGCFIERLRWTRSDLYACIGVEGFIEEAIRRVLAYHEAGGLRGWLWSDMERRQLTGMTWDTWQPDYMIDGLHYWNAAEGRALQELGVDIGDADPLGYYEVQAILIGNEVVFCKINDDPLLQRPYYHASYDPVPGAFWGNGVYDLGRDCQAMINGSVRALNANMGLASGPMMGVDVSMLAEGEDPKAIGPLQQIQLDKSRARSADAKALEFFQADSNSTDLIKIMGEFEQRLDDLTGVPRLQAPGMGGVSQGDTTATQERIEIALSSKSIRRAVAGIDMNVVAPAVHAMFVWEMIYGEDQAAKGPANVVARGSMALLVKEHLQESRNALLDKFANSPVLSRIAGDSGIAELARAVVGTADLNVDKIIPDEETLRQRQQNAPPPMPTPDAQLKASTDLQKAKLNAEVKLTTEGMIHPRAAGPLAGAASAIVGGAPQAPGGPGQGQMPQQGMQ